ncbi:hypothetical protein FJT64_025285 [Amphibalanus amphitrite]|uniref:Uncharacterized protein n=1 Tax=Amphibalanus amphitrite TaxID=1232801 RepID=A0A6A4WIQ4_AMPAM|nr:hypothetical protein FJT64_025285 [Amphibalanus amphitrite]
MLGLAALSSYQLMQRAVLARRGAVFIARAPGADGSRLAATALPVTAHAAAAETGQGPAWAPGPGSVRRLSHLMTAAQSVTYPPYSRPSRAGEVRLQLRCQTIQWNEQQPMYPSRLCRCVSQLERRRPTAALLYNCHVHTRCTVTADQAVLVSTCQLDGRPVLAAPQAADAPAPGGGGERAVRALLQLPTAAAAADSCPLLVVVSEPALLCWQPALLLWLSLATQLASS